MPPNSSTLARVTETTTPAATKEGHREKEAYQGNVVASVSAIANLICDTSTLYLPSPRNPLSVELLSFRANLLQQHGEFDKSLNDYLVLTKRRPLEPKWWLGAAISADSLHQSALAFHAFSQVVKIDTQQILSPNVHHYAQERMARLREVVK